MVTLVVIVVVVGEMIVEVATVVIGDVSVVVVIKLDVVVAVVVVGEMTTEVAVVVVLDVVVVVKWSVRRVYEQTTVSPPGVPNDAVWTGLLTHEWPEVPPVEGWQIVY